MRIIGNDQKNNGQNFWKLISSIIGAGLACAWFKKPVVFMKLAIMTILFIYYKSSITTYYNYCYSTRELQRPQYFKSVFMKIQN